MTAPDLSIVVPVFNNASTLDELIDRLIATLDGAGIPNFELIFVDDGSRDDSYAMLARRAAADPRVRAHALTRNFGSQSAICAGFDLVKGRRAACLDADLENYPEDIPALIAPLEDGHDLVCGVREQRRDPLFTRRVPSAFMNWWVRHRTGSNVRDIGCGMRAMDARILRNLPAEGEHRRLVTPMLLRRARSVVEVPIRHRPSSLRLGHSFLTLLGIAADYYLLTARRPFLISGLLAAAAIAIAIGLALLALIVASPLLGVAALLLAVSGLLGGLLSLVGDYVQRVYQLGQGIPFYQLREEDPDAPEAKAPKAATPRPRAS